MAVRYYLANVIGTGTTANPFRPATTSVLPTYQADDGRTDSTVAGGRMLVTIDADDATHAQIAAASGVTHIPFENAAGAALALTDPISAIDPVRRAAIRNALEAAHIDTDDLQPSDPIGMVLLRIKRRMKMRNSILKLLDFSEGMETTIGAIPAARRTNINTRLQQAGFDTTVLSPQDTIREAMRKLWRQNRRALATDLG